MKTLKITTLSILLLLAWSGSSLAQTDQSRFAVPLTNPGKPGSLNVGLIHGSIKVLSYDGKDVIVQYELKHDSRRDDAKPAPPGMRRIPANNGGIEANESDNKVTIDTEFPNTVAQLNIKVPVNFSVSLSTVTGDIDINALHGNLDLNNVNGDITVTDVSGSANVTTVNGDIKASFSSVDPNSPMAFSTLNGDIDVTLPAAAKFSTKMKTTRGDIYTDFNMDLTGSGKTKVVSGRDNGEYKVSIDDWQYGKVNGGGPELLFKTFNGDIYIRKK